MELIKIQKQEFKNDEKIDTVMARDLHGFLESGQQFSDWIKAKITKGRFELGNDYIVIHKLTKNQNGGRPPVEYHISIDMAKMLSMMENTEKGDEVRQYFIDCEKKMKEYSIKNPPTLPDFSDPVAAARAWADAKEEELKTKLKLEEAQPKIEFHDQVGDSEGLLSVAVVAQMLGTGRNRFFKWLRGESIFYGTQPYQSYIERGYFEVNTTTANDHVQKQSFVTPKGLIWLQKKY